MAAPERRTFVIAGLVLALGGLTGCSEDEGGATGSVATEGPAITSYVALGDSFTAAPLVPNTSLAEGCFRSSGNYPSLVADELDANLRDVSCSGASTADLAGRQQLGFGTSEGTAPPQLDAVRRGTDLVTLGIGGNDEQLFQTLVQQCTAVASQPGAPCTDLVRSTFGDPATVFRKVGRRVTRVLEAIERKAPDAVVVLVGYPRLVDADSACPLMPLAEGDLPLVADLERRLNRTLARSARSAGAEYADMYTLSRGHEICSDDPWVNGKQTDQQRAAAYHPFAEGQQAVADELLTLLNP